MVRSKVSGLQQRQARSMQLGLASSYRRSQARSVWQRRESGAGKWPPAEIGRWHAGGETCSGGRPVAEAGM